LRPLWAVVPARIPSRLLTGRISGYVALFHGEDDTQVRWVVMPVDLGLEPGPESLGSNDREDDQAA